MWAKTAKNAYVNLDSGAMLQAGQGKSGRDYTVSYVDAGGATTTLENGYESASAAQGALDELMDNSEFAVLRVTPPVTEEEKATEDTTKGE